METWYKATLKATVSLRYYKLTHGNDVLHEIDIPNMDCTIGVVDQLAVMRASLEIKKYNFNPRGNI